MKDLLIGFFKMLFELLFKAAKEALKKVDFKKVGYDAYMAYRPKLEVKTKESESKMDDAALKAIDVIVDKFLKPEVK